MTLTLSLKVTDHVHIISLRIPYRLSIILTNDLGMTLKKIFGGGAHGPPPHDP